MKQSLQIKLGQQLTMTPQLQQAIKLLQLSSLELELEIQTAIESNPMLEIQEDELADELPVDTKWEDLYLNLSNYQTSSNSDFDITENLQTNTTENSLEEYLKWQLNLTTFSTQEQEIATIIIDAISDDGYLTISTEEIQASIKSNLKIDLDTIEKVLDRIQQFDPQGVGARDLKECLEIQLSSLPESTPYIYKVKQLVANHLDLLAKKNYSRLKNRLKLSDEELHAIIDVLTCLNPRPGTKLSKNNSEYIIPDVIVMKKNGCWSVELNKDCAPKVRVNPGYAALVKRADTTRDNKFLQEQLSEAKWFLKSLHNRHETLLKVATCIVEQQRAFLEYGEEAMTPMVLQDIAQTVGLHESTISRITTRKYMMTPKGIYELKFFFSSHVRTVSGGECSSTAIRAQIKKLINNEQTNCPLSDNKIANLLAENDVKIARRTVAKYRELIGIPPSNQRKKH